MKWKIEDGTVGKCGLTSIEEPSSFDFLDIYDLEHIFSFMGCLLICFDLGMTV